MYHKKSGSNRGRNGGKVKLAVPDVELKATLTTGRLIGTTGRIALPLLHLDWFTLTTGALGPNIIFTYQIWCGTPRGHYFCTPLYRLYES